VFIITHDTTPVFNFYLNFLVNNIWSDILINKKIKMEALIKHWDGELDQDCYKTISEVFWKGMEEVETLI